MKDVNFVIIGLLCAGFGTILVSYFSKSVESGQGFGLGMIFCLILWTLFKKQKSKIIK